MEREVREFLAINGHSWQNLKIGVLMRKSFAVLAVFCLFSSPVFAQTGTDLAQSEKQAIDSVQWFKTHFPEAMTTTNEDTRLMQHSVEEIPVTEQVKNADTESIAQ